MGGGVLFVTMVIPMCILAFAFSKVNTFTNVLSSNSSSRNDRIPARIAMQAETSRTIVPYTPNNHNRHVGPTDLSDIVHLRKLEFKTNHGPLNTRYLSPDTSLLDTSTDESNIADEAGATRQNHTTYTNIQTTRSPISHGLHQTLVAARSSNARELPFFYNIRTDSGPYYPVYSYNIVQQ